MHILRPMSIDDLRMLAAALPDTSLCARPGCTTGIRYRRGTGRRQRFCSGACRAKFSRERSRLHQLLRRLGDTHGADASIPADQIEVLESQIRWLLDAYGGVDEQLLREGIFTRLFPSHESILDWSRRRREADHRAM